MPESPASGSPPPSSPSPRSNSPPPSMARPGEDRPSSGRGGRSHISSTMIIDAIAPIRFRAADAYDAMGGTIIPPCHHRENRNNNDAGCHRRHHRPESERSSSSRRRRHRWSRRSPSYNVAVFSFLLLIFPSSHGTAASGSSASFESSEPPPPSSPFRIVIDAGSTGSRLHIFEIVATTAAVSADNDSDNDESDDDFAPRNECQRRGTSKAWTPLSAFASAEENDEEEEDSIGIGIGIGGSSLNATHVAHHMLPLFDYASIVVPTEFHPYTPVRIAATAGMRLHPSRTQDRVYDALYEGLRKEVETGRFTFTDLKRGDVLTLSGEREGYFGAVAANYLRGVVDAELKVIVPPDDDDDDEAVGTRVADGGDRGLCTNKFGMCEEDAENIVFGPSHHYVPRNEHHDVKRHGPLGALDMGGSSTQIVYRNTVGGNGGDLASSGERESGGAAAVAAADYDVPSHLHDEEFFSTSYLSYGADQFRERLWDLWASEAEKNSPKNGGGDGGGEQQNRPVIFNPCSFVGYRTMHRGYSLLGTGNALLCAEQINRLIPHHDDAIDLDELYDENVESSRSKEEERESRRRRRPQRPRASKGKMVGGVEHPPLTGKFYGMSLYFFTLDCLRELSDPDHPIRVSWPTPSIEELTHALDAFCAREWAGDLEEVQHEAHEHTRAEVLPHRCVEAVYMVTLLRDGFGFRPSSRDITFTQWVSGNEVEWSLGMVLSEFAMERGTHREESDRVDAV